FVHNLRGIFSRIGRSPSLRVTDVYLIRGAGGQRCVTRWTVRRPKPGTDGEGAFTVRTRRLWIIACTRHNGSRLSKHQVRRVPPWSQSCRLPSDPRPVGGEETAR